MVPTHRFVLDTVKTHENPNIFEISARHELDYTL